MRILMSVFSLLIITMSAGAMAQENFQGLETIGKPEPKGIGFQFPATELMRDVVWLDNFLLIIITAISVFVTLLIAYASYKFHISRNKQPETFTHNSVVEVMWTVIPVIILLFIGVFSLPILFKQQEIPKADINGHDCFTFLQGKLQEERDALASEKRKYHVLTGKDSDDRTH